MCLQIQAHVLSIDGKWPINFAYSLISKNTQDKSVILHFGDVLFLHSF